MAVAAGDIAPGAAGALLGRPSRSPNPGVRLAVGILLFWIAGLLFFIAFGAGLEAFRDMSWTGGGKGLSNLRAGLSNIFSTGEQHVEQATNG